MKANLFHKVMRVAQALVMGLGLVAAAGTAYGAQSNCGAPGSGNGSANPLVAGASCSQGNAQKENLFGQGGVFTVAANTLIFIVGAVSVIFIIVGGLRYVTSNGDSKRVTAARDTILYAVVGVVISIISFALVNFVIKAINQAN